MTPYQHARQSHTHCVVCGKTEEHASPFDLHFTSDGDSGICASFQVTTQHQGYTGLQHGGITATLLDAAMTHCLFRQGVMAVTAELTVRYLAPIQIGDRLQLAASVVQQRHTIYQLEASLCREAKIVARATAKFIQPKAGGFGHAR